MKAVLEGQEAPDFTLPASSGESVTLSDLRGRSVILYFYPKDNTSGCTLEACNFRDAHDQMTGANAVVLGVSPDSVTSHDRFAAEYGLPFLLLADTDHRVAEQYGAWTERSMYGRRFMGIQRSTFLIDPEGRIKKVWPKVQPKGHVEEVLAALAS